jgi:hypothetical protein
MGNLSMKRKANKVLSEQEIDKIVVAQANDDSAWVNPIRVLRSKPASLSIPADLAARAAFLAFTERYKRI